MSTSLKMEDAISARTFTIEDAYDNVGFGTFQMLILLYAGMSYMAEAMELMLLSFVGPAVQDLWNLSPRQVSIISSVVFAGMMLGAYSWGVLSDMKGRRIGFFATAVLTFVAGFSSTFSPNYYSLLLLRGLVGVGLGGGPVFSSWFMEFTPSPNRELPGLVVAAAIVDRVGRKHSMAGLFGLCGLFLLPLLYRQPETFTTFLLFGARACIMGSFTILYIYAPEP